MSLTRTQNASSSGIYRSQLAFPVSQAPHVEKQSCNDEGQTLRVAYILIIPEVSLLGDGRQIYDLQTIRLDHHVQTLLAYSAAFLEVFVMRESPTKILDYRFFMGRSLLE